MTQAPIVTVTIESTDAISSRAVALNEAAKAVRAIWGSCGLGTPATAAMADLFDHIKALAKDAQAEEDQKEQ